MTTAETRDANTPSARWVGRVGQVGQVGWVGSLAHTPLAEVFQRIVQEGRSGDLQVTLPSAIKTVYFDRGFVVFASSNLKSDRLGESMIEAGRISREEFALASMVIRSSHRKLGETLVEAGIVSEEELGQYVAAQVNRIVLSLFSAKTGMYSFDERPCTIPVNLMVSLSVYRILLEGIRRMSRKKLVVAGLPPLETELRAAPEPPFSLDPEHLRPVEKDVLRLAEEGTSIAGIARAVGENEGVALRAAYGLYAAGILEAVAPAPVVRTLRVQEETGTFVLSEIRNKVQPIPEEPPPPPELAEVEPGFEPEEPYEPPAELVQEAAPEPEESDDASDEAPATAPVALRPKPAPKPHGRSSRFRLPEWMKVPLRGIENALLRWVGSSGEAPEPAPVKLEPPTPPLEPEAPPPDEPYELAEAPPTEPVTSEPAEEAASSEAKNESTAASVSPEPPLTSLDHELYIETELPRDEAPSMLSHIPIEEVASEVDEFEVDLELPEEAGFELAEGAPSVPPMTEVPEVRQVPRIEETTPPATPPEPEPVTTAALVDERSSKPESSVADAAASSREDAVRRVEQSGGESRLLRDVKLHFKLQDWEGAVPLLEQLVLVSPESALYRGMLARAMSRHPTMRKHAEEHFIEALRLAPEDAELHYWLGLYYKSFGLKSRAYNEFRTTLRIDPRHEGARNHVAGGRKDDAIGGVFKKIFG